DLNRLKIARDLLRDDGFIAISIDENEYSPLKMLCDEIYGEDNHLSTHFIQVRYKTKSLNERNDWQPIMEYVLFYAKNTKGFKANRPFDEYDVDSKFVYEINEKSEGEKVNFGGREVKIFKADEWEMVKHDKGHIDLLKETWASGSVITGNASGKYFDTYLSGRTNIDGTNALYKVEGIGEDGLGYRYFCGPKSKTGKRGRFYSGIPTVRRQAIESEGGSKKYKPIVNFYDYSAEIGNIRHEGGVPFNNGKKPIKLLKQIINYHQKKDAIILDFFAGSGSTAHAVLDLNKDDEGSRTFIIGTNNENNI